MSAMGVYEDPAVLAAIAAHAHEMPAPAARIARRVSVGQAREHFDAGGDVLVSEHGHRPTWPVNPDTTLHNRERITWRELRAMVAMWRRRYPNQRFYVVE